MKVRVEIYANKMVVDHADQRLVVKPEEAFTTQRLLVGTFDAALACLKNGLKQAGVMGLFKSKPNLLIVAMEMCEGGLSEVEQRCLRELGFMAGAGKVEVLGARS